MKDLAEHIKTVVDGRKIDEVLSPDQLSKGRQELSVPDMRPQTFDVTVDGWIARVKLWGKVKIRHEDPENKIKEDISVQQFISRLTDNNLLKMFGTWNIEEIAINKIEIYRNYVGMDGRQYKEKFVVEIELKDELKKAIKGKGLFGLF